MKFALKSITFETWHHTKKTITKSDKINVKIDDKSLIYLLNSALRYDTTNRLYDSLNPTFNTLDNVLPPLKSMRI